MLTQDELKAQVGRAAIDFVVPGSVVGEVVVSWEVISTVSRARENAATRGSEIG